MSFLAINFDIFGTIGQVIGYISTLLSFLASMCNVVISLFSSFFVSMPSFISIGFTTVFGLGITIMIIKLVR